MAAVPIRSRKLRVLKFEGWFLEFQCANSFFCVFEEASPESRLGTRVLLLQNLKEPTQPDRPDCAEINRSASQHHF